MRGAYKPLFAASIMLMSVIGSAFAQGGTGRETSTPAPAKKTTSAKKSAPAKKSSLPTKASRGGAAKPYPKAESDEVTKGKEDAENKRAGTVVKNSIGMELVYVPAGSFMMGSENGSSSEKPVHQVTFNSGFYMGRYEVTQALWQTVMGSNPSEFKGCDQCSVEQISWSDVQEFMRRLNARADGFNYGLPSEAEWEYACRAGATGNDVGNLDEGAWTLENSGDKRLRSDELEHNVLVIYQNHNRTHPVGQKQPNAWGLYDMYGNVWELCEDKWHDSYYDAPKDGSAWLGGRYQALRVMRGFSWSNSAIGLKAAARGSVDLNVGHPAIGFRVVAIPQT